MQNNQISSNQIVRGVVELIFMNMTPTEQRTISALRGMSFGVKLTVYIRQTPSNSRIFSP